MISSQDKFTLNRIQVIRGDITTLKVDAIVNAANSGLRGGGGVDGAIHAAAGPELQVACRAIGGCPTGEVRLTPGFKLPAKFILHAVGPVWQGGDHQEAQLLASCYRNALETAAHEGFDSIAFPSISTGIYGYPLEEATEVALDVIVSFLKNHAQPETVILVCFNDSSYQTCLEALRQRRLK